MIRITKVIVPLTYDLNSLKQIGAKRLHIDEKRIEDLKIAKRGVNNEDKQNVYFDMELIISVSGDEDEVIYGNKDRCTFKEIEPGYTNPKVKAPLNRPVVVGCGPAGLFAGLILAEAGAKPILLERGANVDLRKQKVEEFWETGMLDMEINVQYGEGGAGAFSDGKLKIGKKDGRKLKILNELVAAGAPQEILYLTKPHIGTDHLINTVKEIREKIKRLGGSVHFQSTLTELLKKDGKVVGLRYIEDREIKELETEHVVLAIGHSAHDTFEMLWESGVEMESKPMAVGVRIEHPQRLIDEIQYSSFAGNPALGAADYKMVVHLENGRAVYTFCMCPGGQVVASASEAGGLVTNGMSVFARNGENANTALLVTVDKSDFDCDSPLAGVQYRRKIEAAAYKAGGGDFFAPVQRLEDFMNKRSTTELGNVMPTYMPGTRFAQVEEYLPSYIAESLRAAIIEMEAWMPGFLYEDALITGAETRSSSPIRINRLEDLQAVGIKGFYPCGEGAGYGGGIISAAVDGVLCAEKIIEQLATDSL